MKSSGASSQARSRKDPDRQREVLHIAQRVAATLGSDFFQSLVKHLAGVLEADCALLAEWIGEPAARLRTLAAFTRQKSAETSDLRLSGSPFSQVLAHGKFTCSHNAARRFPSDPLLESLHAEGFVGVRLSDSAGLPVGVLAAISRSGFTNTPLVRSVLAAFAARAAAELERKRADDLRRENQERYQAFIVQNPDAMWRLELEQPIPLSLPSEEQVERLYSSAYLAECNQAFARLFGARSIAEVVGSRFETVVPRRDARLQKELRAIIQSGFRQVTVETSPLDANGRPCYRLRSHFGIVENGELRRIWGCTRDITDLRRAEISLAATEQRFHAVLENIRLPAVMLDAAGAVAFCNQCFIDLTGRTREELTRLLWLESIVPQSETAVWKKALATREGSAAHFEGTVIARDHASHTVEWDTVLAPDPPGEPTRMAAIGRDVTQQRSLENEIRQAQKLESIGRLSAGLAHDFNNLLTVVLGYTGEILRHTPETDPNHARLSAVSKAVTECTTLTGQLLAVGRKQRLKPAPVSLNEVIAAYRPILDGLVGSGIQWDVHLEASPAIVFADGEQLQRVLANLAANARDAMPAGGVVTLETSTVVVRFDDPHHPGVAPGSYVQLLFRDNGTGMTDDTRAHVFEPFFTTKAKGKGVGLGLSTVYGIVTQSGGHIAVETHPGEGTTFRILLPVA